MRKTRRGLIMLIASSALNADAPKANGGAKQKRSHDGTKGQAVKMAGKDVHVLGNYAEVDGQLAFHPGYYIGEIVQFGGMSLKTLSKKSGIQREDLELIMAGKNG